MHIGRRGPPPPKYLTVKLLVIFFFIIYLAWCAQQQTTNSCAEQELVAGNNLFRKRDASKCLWVRMVEARVSDGALIDHVLSPKQMCGRLLDVNVCSRKGMSDHS